MGARMLVPWCASTTFEIAPLFLHVISCATIKLSLAEQTTLMRPLGKPRIFRNRDVDFACF